MLRANYTRQKKAKFGKYTKKPIRNLKDIPEYDYTQGSSRERRNAT